MDFPEAKQKFNGFSGVGVKETDFLVVTLSFLLDFLEVKQKYLDFPGLINNSSRFPMDAIAKKYA